MHFGAIAVCGVSVVAGLLYLRKCATGPYDLQNDQLTIFERLAAFLYVTNFLCLVPAVLRFELFATGHSAKSEQQNDFVQNASF
jgi:hypothetical protein